MIDVNEQDYVELRWRFAVMARAFLAHLMAEHGMEEREAHVFMSALCAAADKVMRIAGRQ